MRKYVIGILMGILLSLGTTAIADEVSKIGKTVEVEYSVKLNGEELDVKAVAFEGTSYAPVRAVGEALGLDVDFKDGTVLLESKEVLVTVIETSKFEEMRSIEVGGEKYFSAVDYNRKFWEKEFLIGYDMESEDIFYERTSEPKDKIDIANKNDKKAVFIHNDMTYINVKLYKTPDELSEEYPIQEPVESTDTE